MMFKSASQIILSLAFAVSSQGATMSYTETIEVPFNYIYLEEAHPFITHDSSVYGVETPAFGFDDSRGTLSAIRIQSSVTLVTEIYSETDPSHQISIGALRSNGAWYLKAASENPESYYLASAQDIGISDRLSNWTQKVSFPTGRPIDEDLLPDGVYGSHLYTDVQDVAFDTGMISDPVALGEVSGGRMATFTSQVRTESVFRDEETYDNVTTLIKPGGVYSGTESTPSIPQLEKSYGGEQVWTMEVTYTYESIPEPSSFAMLGLGSIGLLGWRRR